MSQAGRPAGRWRARENWRAGVRRMRWLLGMLASTLVLAGCSSTPLMPYSAVSTPLMLVPALERQGQDGRARFQQIFCSVLDARQRTLPDYRECASVIVSPGRGSARNTEPVHLGTARRPLRIVFIGGLGSSCVANWIAQDGSINRHLQSFGWDMVVADINGLGSSQSNARDIKDAILALSSEHERPDLVLVGYSKGAPDMLTALVQYPQMQSRVAAVVSLAGAIGGTPLANDAPEAVLNALQFFPGSTCHADHDGALRDLRPQTRKAWLATNSLPDTIPSYSVITLPEPANISMALRGSYKALSQVDARNDGQLLFYDQFIPKSTLVAYLNADHWAVATPITRQHAIVGAVFATKNAFPREALYEALLRFIEEDLERRDKARLSAIGIPGPRQTGPTK